MAELKLNPKPTFLAKVEIELHDDEKPAEGQAQSASAPAVIWFTFKHRTRKQLDEWLVGEKADVDAIMEMAEGWDRPEPFTRENVTLLEQNYQGAPLAILRKYIDKLRQAKLGN